MISSFGDCSRQRTISTRWRSPTDMLCTQPRRVDRQAVTLRDVADARRERAPAVDALVQRQRDIFGHASAFRTARSAGTPCRCPGAAHRAGLRDADRLAFPFDAAGIRPRHAVDDFHQGAFAGAVLAQHGMDFAGGDAKSIASLAGMLG